MAKELGWRPITDIEAERLRAYGAPLYQRGALPIDGTSANFFAQEWAINLILDWPLGPGGDDFDHHILKALIRRTARSGDVQFAQAACSVAMLGGADAVRKYLEID